MMSTGPSFGSNFINQMPSFNRKYSNSDISTSSQSPQNMSGMPNLVIGPSPNLMNSNPQVNSGMRHVMTNPTSSMNGMTAGMGGRNFDMGGSHNLTSYGYGNLQAPNTMGMGLGSGGLWNTFNRFSGNPANNNLIY